MEGLDLSRHLDPQDWNRCPKKAYVDGPGLSPRTSPHEEDGGDKEAPAKEMERECLRRQGDPKECGVLEA